MALIRRDEELLRLGVNQHSLHSRFRFQPESHTPVTMMIVEVHREHLASDAKGRRTPRLFLLDFRQGQANAACARDLIYLAPKIDSRLRITYIHPKFVEISERKQNVDLGDFAIL
jgi:hypothetical protein